MDAERMAHRALELHDKASLPLADALQLALNEAHGAIWPCAKLVIRDGMVCASSHQYAPGLPDGEHDVYPLPADADAAPVQGRAVDFDAVRDKRMSELTPAQRDDALELWIREQVGFVGKEHIPFLLRRVDEARGIVGVPPRIEPNGPEFTDWGRTALLWVLWHHQGGSSEVGQPIRFALGMGQHDRLSDSQIADAKRWAELTRTRGVADAAKTSDGGM